NGIDSGTIFQITIAYSAGRPPIRKAVCQPKSGMIKRDTRAATNQPSPQKLSSNTIKRPRTCAGIYSLTSVTATGNCPPRPKPTIKRNTNNQVKFGAKAQVVVVKL